MLLPSEHKMGALLLLLLRTTKRDAPDSAHVVLSIPVVLSWMEPYKSKFCADKAPHDALFGISYSTFLKCLRRATFCLGFEPGF